MTTRTLTIKAADFAALVKPLIPIAGNDDMLPVLNAIHFRIVDGWLIGNATDRFRVAWHRQETGSKNFTALVRLADVREILRVFKQGRYAPELVLRMTATAAGFLKVSTLKPAVAKDNPHGKLLKELNRRRAAFIDASMTFPLEDGAFPNTGHILTDPDWKAEARSWFGVNPVYLADWRHAVERNSPLVVVPSVNPSGPVLFAAGENFIGMQMPLRVGSFEDAPPNVAPVDVESWGALFEQIPAVSRDVA